MIGLSPSEGRATKPYSAAALSVPVMADTWRAARKDAIEQARRIEAFRHRRILRTHTEPSIAWGPDFQTWSVTIEFDR